MSKKKALYIDIDGTLARFHDADKMFIEAMWTPGFYVNLKPFESLVAAVKQFKERNPDVEVFVLSAVLDTDPPFIVGEKNEWLDKYLPEIDKEHRIFTRAGEDKSNYINMNDYDCSILDDYNKNLYEFEAAGGTAIKFHNDINHRGLGEFGGSKGNMWQGAIVHHNDAPGTICRMLEKHIGLSKELADFIIEDDVLVEYIGTDETVKIPNGIREIGINAFENNPHVKHVQFPDSLEIISSGAFGGVDLHELNLPEGLKIIEKNAFVGCNFLEQVKIPSSVTFLHNEAFNICERLKNINIDAANDKYFSVAGIVYEHDKDTYVLPDIIRCPTGKSGEIVIAGDIDKIAPQAFMNCTHISEVKLPNTLYSIAEGAFCGCTGLEKIVLPDSTTRIYDNVFAVCTNLKKIGLPDNILSMGHGIFDGCRNLSMVAISDEALVNYCERFNLLEEVYMTPCYESLKERYETLTKGQSIDNLIKDANVRCGKADTLETSVEIDID